MALDIATRCEFVMQRSRRGNIVNVMNTITIAFHSQGAQRPQPDYLLLPSDSLQ